MLPIEHGSSHDFLTLVDILHAPTEKFLGHVDQFAQYLLDSADTRDENGYFSQEAWRRLVTQAGILTPGLGDRDTSPELRQREALEIGRILARHDLGLGLIYGITGALVLQPATQFRPYNPELSDSIHDQLRQGALLGLGITDYGVSGSSPLSMNSKYEIQEDGSIRLQAKKHLQGNSGRDGLIVAARNGSKLGLFFVPQSRIDTELTPMNGLHEIQYGINTIDTQLSSQDMLVELNRKQILTEFMPLFIRSRLQFVATCLGHTEHMQQLAHSYAHERLIGTKYQYEMPAVQARLATIDGWQTASEAMYESVLASLTFESEIQHRLAEANCIKALSSEYALKTSLARADLLGGNAYYINGGMQDANDIWPFTRFEGPNEMLYTQVGETVLAGVRNNDIGPEMKGFATGQYSDFVDFLNQTGAYKPELSLHESVSLVEPLTQMALSTILPSSYGDHQVEVIGSISARLYALRNLDKVDRDDQTLSNTYLLLNLEIRQLVDQFHTIGKLVL